MGMFDTFVSKEGLEVQLKVGPCMLNRYEVGDYVEGVPDGVYTGHEGAVRVAGGKVIYVSAETQDNDSVEHYSKWGDRVSADWKPK